MANEAGETEMIAQMQVGSVSQVFGRWSFTASFLGVFLGAIAVASEIQARVIVTILARPIDRWLYLIGRWVGIAAYLVCFALIGAAIGLALVWKIGVHFTPLLWIGVADFFISTLFFSAASLALSTFLPPVLGGAGAFLLSIVAVLTRGSLDHPRAVIRVLAWIGYYVAPAHLPVDAIEDSMGRQLIDPDYTLYVEVLLENVLYSAVLLIGGCVVFDRRELRLR
jgi:ABC-type transport system involved in multi-copper enzyme maturation permease subunit